MQNGQEAYPGVSLDQINEQKFRCSEDSLVPAELSLDSSHDMAYDDASHYFEVYEPENSRALVKAEEMPPAIRDGKLLGG